MRLLKQKIAKFQALKAKKIKVPIKKRQRTHNMVRNFGRALLKFATSIRGDRFIQERFPTTNFNSVGFTDFLMADRLKVQTITGLRDLFTIQEVDNQEVQNYRTVFKSLCLKFIEEESLDWIAKGKILDKKRHLKYRIQILNRLQNPFELTNS